MINNVCCVSFAGHRLIISIIVKEGRFFHENDWILNEFQMNEAIKLTIEFILEVDIQQYFRFYSFKTKWLAGHHKKISALSFTALVKFNIV